MAFCRPVALREQHSYGRARGQQQKGLPIQVRGFAVSPDHSLLAYAVDTVGGEKFTLHVVDLATRQELLTKSIEVRPPLLLSSAH